MRATGPCIGLDTACSSSLVTTHLAANAVRSQEAGTGITAGVNVMFSPMITAAICQLQVTEPVPMQSKLPVIGTFDGICSRTQSAARGRRELEWKLSDAMEPPGAASC